MSRDGAPLSRYGDELDQELEELERRVVGVGRELEELERRVVVGAPPTGIDFNPSGRVIAEAYVDRVDRAADRLNGAFVAWLREKWTDPPIDEQKPATTQERAFIVEWPPWLGRWKAAYARFHAPEWVFKPSPSGIWLETQQFDEELEAYRLRFAELTKDTVVKAPPGGTDPGGGHEDPGGIKQPGLLDGLEIGDTLATVAKIIVGGAVALGVLAVVKR